MFPESLVDLDKDTRLGFHGMGKSEIDRSFKSIFFDTSPLNLKETADQDKLMEYLIFYAAEVEVKKDAVTHALNALKAKREKAGEWYHPLFAILIGDTLKQADPKKPLPNPDTWNRRQLIENYLSNNRRLPWLMSEPQTALEKHHRDYKLWAASCVSVATARRGMDFDLLTDCIPQDEQRNQVSLPHIKDYCRSITSKLLIKDTIPPLEPDILGETYFLLFLKALKDGYNTVLPLRSPFMAMLSCGEEQLQATDALQFIGFITRLTRNLCNDNQNDKIVSEHWKTPLDFLNPAQFPAESTMR